MLTVAAVVKLVPSVEVWILYWDAYAVSQLITTSFTCWLLPRSTCHHSPSLNCELQRVPVSPSTALAGPSDAASWLDAVVGLPCAMSASADCGKSTRNRAAAHATTTATR